MTVGPRYVCVAGTSTLGTTTGMPPPGSRPVHHEYYLTTQPVISWDKTHWFVTGIGHDVSIAFQPWFIQSLSRSMLSDRLHINLCHFCKYPM